MTDPLAALLNPTDFGKFKSKDQDWFLGVVGDTIRDFCGWHIFPVISETNIEAKIGNNGIVMLPTLNLVSVEEVRVGDVAITGYQWNASTAGYLTLMTRRGRNLPVLVDMTHGYEALPKAVAEVGYELTATVLEKPAGVVTEMQRGPTSMTFKEFGVVLSDDQKNRLGPYTVTRL